MIFYFFNSCDSEHIVICEVHQFWQSYKMHLLVFTFLFRIINFVKKKKAGGSEVHDSI
jgi:hypothetical protein